MNRVDHLISMARAWPKLGRGIFPGGVAALLLAGCAGTAGMRPGAFTTVVIDAGHGGKDNGGRSRSGLMEKNVALDTAQRLRPLLQRAGLRTVMTRSSDHFVELDSRVTIADLHPDAVLVSLHYNASPSRGPQGVETFFWRADSYGLASRVENELAAATGLERRGATRRVLRLTHNPRIPAILCECGFLSNPGEASRIADGDFRQRVAEGIARGIVEQRGRGDSAVGYLPPARDESIRRRARHDATGRRAAHRRRGR